jgi:predicted ester cyclase
VARVRLTGTHRGPFMGLEPTGRTVDAPPIDIMRFGDDGLAREHWGVFDALGMLRQLAVVD